MRRAFIAAITLAAGGAGAQTQPRLDRVTPGVGDIGPSSVDTRIAPPDLRQPVGFEGVYRVGTPTPGALDARPLVRISGATLALFPRSAYMVTRNGPLPQIPAGTVFYLGHLPEEFTRPPPPMPASMLALPLDSHALELNLSADLPRADGAPAEHEPTSMFSDEGFRRGRVAELLALPVK